jgi:hypothetical protein
MVPSITQDAINTALGNFLASILPAGTSVVVGQVNRVASPEGDYCVMWPLRRPRLATNVDTTVDVSFTGSITSTVMTVTEIVAGDAIKSGLEVFGVGVASNTMVLQQINGTPGGAGSYTVSPAQTLALTAMAAGYVDTKQPTEVVMQVDVHGPAGSDNVQTIATLFRDDYGVTAFAGTGITPLYAEDPRQLAFETAADQFEDRWMVDLHMQFDPSILIPQQFADQAVINVVSVEAAFPPA